MAEAGSPGVSYKFKFTKGPAIETYVGDITQAHADMLVVPEGVSFKGLGYIGRQMMELSSKFRNSREKLMSKKKNKFAAWETYTSTLDGKPFKHVIHAIVVPCPDQKVEEWSNKMHLLYQRIFQEADRKIATVLAVPFLGTGRGGGRLEDTIEAAVNSVVNFKQTNLKRILFVSVDPEIVVQIASRCEWERAHGGRGKKWRPLENGENVTYTHSKAMKARYPSVATDLKYQPMKTTATLSEKKEPIKSREKKPTVRQSGTSYDSIDESGPKMLGHPSVDQENATEGLKGPRKHTLEILHGHHVADTADRKINSDVTNANDVESGIMKEISSTVASGKDQGHDPRVPSDSASSFDLDDISKPDRNVTDGNCKGIPRPIHFRRNSEISGSQELHADDIPDLQSRGTKPRDKKHEPTRYSSGYICNYGDDSGKEMCPICICEITDKKTLDKCGHAFCRNCIDNSFQQFKPVCPSCNMVYGEIRGNQPDGQMDEGFSGEHLPGYEGHGTITIKYSFSDGIQGMDHPNPGQPFKGTSRFAYLPDNEEGNSVLELLRKAFIRRLTFTIGRSTTTGQENVVTWNDIHHKTNKDGGPTRFGYPDKTYLQRVREELASKGVTS